MADRPALAALLDRTGNIALVYSGDGGAGEGAFHEAVNVAAVWNLPLGSRRCFVMHEATLTGGLAGEIAATIGEQAFLRLDFPVMRLGVPDTPLLFNPALEQQFLPCESVRKLCHVCCVFGDFQAGKYTCLALRERHATAPT